MDSVLPVLVPGMDLGDLEIRDRMTATAQYIQALRSTSRSERQQIFRSTQRWFQESNPQLTQQVWQRILQKKRSMLPVLDRLATEQRPNAH